MKKSAVRFATPFFCVIALSALTACGSAVESELKSLVKCGSATALLQQPLALVEIAQNIRRFENTHSKEELSDSMMERVTAEVKAELNISAGNPVETRERLIQIFDSSACQALHTQGEFSPD